MSDRRMTAAATTGPAHGPRPASSMPQMDEWPERIAAVSKAKWGGMGSPGHVRSEDDRGGDNRAGPRAPAGFIDAADGRMAGADCGVFQSEMGGHGQPWPCPIGG